MFLKRQKVDRAVTDPASQVIFIFDLGTRRAEPLLTRADFEKTIDTIHQAAKKTSEPMYPDGYLLALVIPAYDPALVGHARFAAATCYLAYAKFGTNKAAGWDYLVKLSKKGLLHFQGAASNGGN